MTQQVVGGANHSAISTGGATSILRFPINGGAPQVTDDTWISAGDRIIENAQLSPVVARIATESITVMNAEVLSHE
jgi:hypothetical protein